MPNLAAAMLICFVVAYFHGIVISSSSAGAAVVTLESIQIHNSHEWLKSSKPDVYFSCIGDHNKTFLPDVKDLNFTYTFNGQESWQPLTQLTSKKCKRCGFYEKDTFKPDDVFEEWEFCPSYFLNSNARYIRRKTNEFDASFLCPLCTYFPAVLVLGVLLLHKYWQKRKREQDQARFLKLFEDGDDIEDELGLDLEM